MPPLKLLSSRLTICSVDFSAQYAWIAEGEKVLKRERTYGKVICSFSLASDVDEATTSVRYNEGVPELVLPKMTASASKRLAVQ